MDSKGVLSGPVTPNMTSSLSQVATDNPLYLYVYSYDKPDSPDNPDIYMHSYDSPDSPDNPDIYMHSYDNPDNPDNP